MIFFPFFVAFAQSGPQVHFEWVLQHRKVTNLVRTDWDRLLIDPVHHRRRPVAYKVNLEKNSIELSGPEYEIGFFKAAASFYDVRKRLVKLDLTCASPAEGIAYESSASIEVDTKWTSSWDVLDESTTIRPRINEDGTVTLFVDAKVVGGLQRIVTRVKSGDQDAISLGKGKPVITIRATAME